jgi:hypothetical protein
MTLIGLIVAVLLLCLAIWAVQTLAAAFNLPPQIRAVLLVLIVVVAVLWLLGTTVGMGPVIRLR